MTEFLEKEIIDFELVEDDEGELHAQKRNSRARCWVGTWNNPKMSDEEFKNHFQKLYEDEYLQYAIFQREKGETNGTIHFQFFVNFANPQYFKKIKEKFLPYGCHFKPMISKASRCKAYCSKVDTRVSGPYEIGMFEEEGQRTDLMNAIKLIDEGVPFETVSKIYMSQCIMYSSQLKARAAEVMRENYSNKARDVEVTYIYGKGGVGKTSGVYKRHGFKDVFFVSSYEKYLFENYDGKKVIVFDEFAGQIKITMMNRYLDIYPIDLRGLGKTYPACYEKVYILSNLAPQEQYRNLDENEKESRDPFFRRLHNIVYIDENGIEHVEKQTIFRDLNESEKILEGVSKTVDKVIYYDRCGKVLKISDFQRLMQQEMELRELSKEEEKSLPWQEKKNTSQLNKE